MILSPCLRRRVRSTTLHSRVILPGKDGDCFVTAFDLAVCTSGDLEGLVSWVFKGLAFVGVSGGKRSDEWLGNDT